MMQAIKIELQKLQNSPTLWILLLIPFLLLFINTYLFVQDFESAYGQTVAVTKDPNPWRFFIESYASTIENCIGLNVLLLVGWLHSLEHRNRMWAKNLLYPISVNQILFAKIILILCFELLVLLVLLFFTILFLKPLVVNRNPFLFSTVYPEPHGVYYRWCFYYLLTVPKFAIFHFWLSLKLHRSFLLAFFIGFIGLLLHFLAFSPYNLFFRMLKPQWNDVILSLVYSLTFLYFIQKEVKSYFT